MASPNFDLLHLEFSRKVEDPVAVATANGSVLDSTDRSDYLNRAIKEFITDAYYLIGMEKARTVFQSMVKQQAVASFLSAGVSVASDYFNMPIALTRTGFTDIFVLRNAKSQLDNDNNPHITAAYVVEGGKIYAYADHAILTSGAGIFYYLPHRDRTAADATDDTPLPTNFFDHVIDLAIDQFYSDIGQQDKVRNLKYKLIAKAMERVGVAAAL